MLDDDAQLQRIATVIEAGPYEADWTSLQEHSTPRWYQNGKFGIFIHWGLYSVPAFGSEWYSRLMYQEGTREWLHHRETFGPQTEFGYKDFIPSFTNESFDPDDWAALFQRSGAQFVVPVAEHHDGFAMYDSERSEWTAAKMGPKRDLFGDLATATRRLGLVVGASTHRAEHWFFMNGGMRSPSDVQDPEFADFYGPAQREETQPTEAYLDDWFLRTIEIIDRYRPEVLWFDWWIEQVAFEPYLRKIAAYYYNSAVTWGREVAINYKWTAFAPGSAVYDIERGAVAGIQPDFFQNDTSVSRTSWGWVEGHEYKPLAELVGELVDVVAKNGALLLNIGPKPDGTIPLEERQLLEGIGDWLAVNGEAIYGSRPWVIAGEGPTRAVEGSFVDGKVEQFTSQDIRFTSFSHVSGEYLFAIALAWPDGGKLSINALGYGSGLLTVDIDEVSILGVRGKAKWEQSWDRLEVALPETPPSSVGVVVKIKLKAPKPLVRGDAIH